jgi:hypothetical protein
MPTTRASIQRREGEHMPKANQPAAKFRLGYVTATVWKNDDFYNVVLSKAYKDGEDWKDTDQLGAGDLMNAVRVLQRAENFIAEQ